MFNYLKKIADSNSEISFANILRNKRFNKIHGLISSENPITILDIGGKEKYWELRGIKSSKSKMILYNIEPAEQQNPNFVYMVGDAKKLSSFDSNSVDVVFSNSVIEHLGTFENQIKMAKEIRRVAKKYYVQTPSYYFPIEPHFLFPFFHWLPFSVRIILLQNFSLGWYHKVNSKREALKSVKQIRLLTKKEVERLIPDSKIYKEKLWGFTKSYIAIKS